MCCCVRRGSAGVSPQSAAVYADATCDPTESQLTANDSPADSPEQSTTPPGRPIMSNCPFPAVTITLPLVGALLANFSGILANAYFNSSNTEVVSRWLLDSPKV